MFMMSHNGRSLRAFAGGKKKAQNSASVRDARNLREVGIQVLRNSVLRAGI